MGQVKVGSNNITHITANRGAVAFTETNNQIILDYPYVLAPQSPDFWMQELVLDNTVLNGTNWTPQLISLIEDFVSKHNEIDPDRIYVGGNSMGGYQTWELLSESPDLFAAAFPIASAYEVPENILKKVSDTPIWITHAIDDDVIPFSYSKSAYERLIEKGNRNVFFSAFKNVTLDYSQYSAHASEVYLLQNEIVNRNGLTFIEWLALQEK